MFEGAQGFVDGLVGRRLITAEQRAAVARAAADSGASPVRLMIRLGLIDQQVLAVELARHFRIRPVEDADWPTSMVLPDRISPRFMREHHVLPLGADARTIAIAVSDPADQVLLDRISIATERTLELRIATESQITSRIERLVDGTSAEPASTAASEGDDDQIKDLALDAPVIDLVNRLFREASAARATDLHIEPSRTRVVVRRRVDGMLHEAGVLPVDLGRAAVSRIKILSQLNIAERRLPQDGRARVRAGDRDYDIRVATMPTIHGESVAIRFLSATSQTPDIETLGLAVPELAKLKAQAALAHGLIIVTGPTGSGKTTTLAAVLSHLNDPSRKILTIEDPVEYQVEGVNQIQVRPDIGLTFAATLRSMLRLDPDIIMVGEMRDAETAKIGVNSALTGHLVLTTLHTNSAAGAVTRLLDLGVQAFLIASTLRCVIAQRLVRRLCPSCRTPYSPAPGLLAGILPGARMQGGERLWKATGCEHCGGTGYHGRAAIFELLVVDENIRKLIRPDASAGTIAGAAAEGGMATMADDGFAKCLAGTTTIEEVARVAAEA